MLLLLLAVFACSCCWGGHPPTNTCPTDWSTLSTPAAMAAVDPSCFASLLYLTVQTFQAPACAGLHAPQLAALATQKPYSACAGFMPACLAAVPSLAGINDACAERLAPATCAVLSGAQLSSITSAARLSATCVGALTTAACASLAPSLVAQLGRADAAQCAGLTLDCFSVLQGSSFALLSPLCFGAALAAHPTLCTRIAPPQAAAIAPALMAALSDSCIASLTPPVCRVLPFRYVSPSRCGAIAPACAAAIESLVNVPTDCTLRLQDAACASLSTSTLASLPPGALSPECLAHVPAAKCNALGSSYLSSLGALECAAVNARCFLAMTSLAPLGHYCAAALPDGLLQNATLAQVESFSANALSSFTGARSLLLSIPLFSHIPSTHRRHVRANRGAFWICRLRRPLGAGDARGRSGCFCDRP